MTLKDVPVGTRFRILDTSPWWDAGWYGTKLDGWYARFHHPSKNASKGFLDLGCTDNECVWAVYGDSEVEVGPIDFTDYDEGGVV